MNLDREALGAKEIERRELEKQVAKKKLLDNDFSGMHPMGDRVIVVPIGTTAKKSTHILLLDEFQEKPYIGKVVAVGPGFLNEKGVREPIDLKKGDFVTFGKQAGHEFDYRGQKILVMRESVIIAKIDSISEVASANIDEADDE